MPIVSIQTPADVGGLACLALARMEKTSHSGILMLMSFVPRCHNVSRKMCIDSCIYHPYMNRYTASGAAGLAHCGHVTGLGIRGRGFGKEGWGGGVFRCFCVYCLFMAVMEL